MTNRVDHYEIESTLGEGGMGVVFRARDTRLNRSVALKILKSSALGSTRERFRREAKALVELSHPHVVKLFDAGEVDGRPYMVMELIAAPDLQHLLDQAPENKLSETRVIEVLDQILDALEASHALGLIHRDIKPSNIMVDGPRALLMDFGLVHDPEESPLTATGKAVGTPHYVAPEMIKGQRASVACDLWAIGVVAYTALSGAKPFEGRSMAELVRAVVTNPHPPLAERAAGISPRLCAVVDRLLAKDPAERYPSAAATRDALRPKAIEPKPRSRPTSRPMVLSKPTPAPVRRTPLVALAAGAALVIAGGGLWAWRASRPAAPEAAKLAAPPRLAWATPESLAIECDTDVPAALEVLSSGQVVTADGPPATRHRLVATLDPWSPPDHVTLRGPGLAAELAVPPGVRVHATRLAAAVRDAKLEGGAVETAWREIRKGLKSVALSNAPDRYAQAVSARPELAAPLDALAARVRAAPGAAAALEALGPHAGRIIAASATPAAQAAQLLGTLAVLDHVDALADVVGRPRPFGVARMLQGAVDVTFTLDQMAEPSPAPGVTMLFPAPGGKKGAAVFLAEDLGVGVGVDTQVIAAGGGKGNRRLRDQEVVWQLAFGVPPASASGGTLRLDMWLACLMPQTYVWLTTPALPAPLPVRLPAGTAIKPDDRFVLAVKLSGRFAAPGSWRIEQRRAISDTNRPFFLVRGIAALWGGP
jgi:hypothetical protein